MPTNKRPSGKAATIAQRNARFGRLSPVNQRKALGRDVLAQLDAGRLVVKEGTYLRVRDQHDDGLTGDLQSLLKQSTTKCTCCALGAAVCAVARLENQLEAEAGYAFTGRASRRLAEVLGHPLYGLVERAFEGWGGYVQTFYAAYPRPRARLRAIYAQIAETGTFDPAKDPKVVAAACE